MKLLLFDIDGTLLVSHGAGRRLFETVLTELCGRPISTANVSFSGRTDPLIVQETLEKAGLPEKAVTGLIPIALKMYAERARYIPSDVQILPGVRSLLDCLEAREDVQLGLLTGNLEHTAFLKLGCANLARYFPFGAFGSDHAIRSRLPDFAAARARRFTGYAYTGTDIVIIGDSIYDVRCGQDNGAFTVAVATGLTPYNTLAAENPDVLLDDLSDSERFCRTVLNADRQTFLDSATRGAQSAEEG